MIEQHPNSWAQSWQDRIEQLRLKCLRNQKGGGEVPQWAGESDRAKERNAEYAERESERERKPAGYIWQCILTAAVALLEVDEEEEEEIMRMSNNSGSYSAVRRTVLKFSSVLSLILLLRLLWCLCSALPQPDVFLACAKVREVACLTYIGGVVPLIFFMLTCLLVFIPFFLSACPSLTCGLQFSRDITALVRRETILTNLFPFKFLSLLASLWCLEHSCFFFAHLEVGKSLKPPNIVTSFAVCLLYADFFFLASRWTERWVYKWGRKTHSHSNILLGTFQIQETGFYWTAWLMQIQREAPSSRPTAAASEIVTWDLR